MFSTSSFSLSNLSLSKLLFSNAKWLEKQQTSINSAAIIIALANGCSILFGFVRTRTILSYFSEDVVTAWTLAFQIPDMLFQFLVFGALSAAFIPVFLNTQKNHSEEAAFKMSSIVLNILLILFSLVSFAVYIFAEPITVWRLGSEITAEQLSIIIDLTRIMLVAQILFTISNVFTGILQSYKRFIIPSIAPIIYNLGIIIGVVTLSGTFGIYSAGIGVGIGAFLHALVQLPLAYKLGFRPSFSLNWRFPGVKQLFLLSPARFITIGINQVQALAIAYFATSIGQLSFLYISYATYLSTFPIRIFGVPLSQAALPFLSQESQSEDHGRLPELITQSLNQIAFLALPTSALLLILRVPLVRLAFGTDNFSWTSTVTTGRILALLTISITAQAMVQLLIRAFHALKDTKTPLYISVLFTCVYIGAAWYVTAKTNLGIVGIGFVSAIGFLLELGLFLLALGYKVPGIISKALLVPQAKMLAASFFMAVFLYLPFRILDELVFDTTKTIELVGLTVTTGTIGVLVYIYFAALLEITELELVKKAVSTFTAKWKTQPNLTQELIIEPSRDNERV